MAAVTRPPTKNVKSTLRITLRNCTTPFEVSSYDRVSDRKSLAVRADDETIAFVGRLDTELKKYAGKVLAVETAEGGLCTVAPPEDFDHARGEISLQVLRSRHEEEVER